MTNEIIYKTGGQTVMIKKLVVEDMETLIQAVKEIEKDREKWGWAKLEKITRQNDTE